jgi:hypothetical protein
VAHTSKQRDKHALCGAKKKDGNTCRKFAGEGTEHFGVGRCKYHLGNSQKHKKHAVMLEAKRTMVEFGQSIEVEPAEALLGVLHLSAGHLNWLREELAATSKKQKATFDGQVLLRAWDEERDRIARISKAALDVGIAAKQIELAERYGEQLAALLRAVFYDPDLRLTVAQRGRLPDLLRRHLGTLDGPPALTRGAAA